MKMAKNDGIKKTWIVIGRDGYPLFENGNDRVKEYPNAKAAIKAAKVCVQTTENTEAWAFVLSHVIARPAAEPTVDIIK
jgi:hypothetical protein